MTWWLVGMAMAGTCPDLAVEVDAGWASFDDAELDGAVEHVKAAYAARACQPEPIDTDALVRLYRLDALVALSRKDRSGGLDAVIREVAVDPEDAPPESLGPELADLHDTWSRRLASARAEVLQVGGGHVWVDGRLVPESGRLSVIGGEHVVQHDGTGAITGEIVDVKGSLRVETGVPGGPVLAEAPIHDVEPAPAAPRSHSARPALLAVGSTALVLGGVGLGYGVLQERAFHANAFRPEAFGDCHAGDACYDERREIVVRASARRVNLIYAAGYALGGVGLVLGSVGLAIAPVPQGVAVTVGGRL